jgi:hypothetical protein
MSDDIFLPFDLKAISRKKVSANLNGGAISSDGGLLLLTNALAGVLHSGPARSQPDQSRGRADATVPHNGHCLQP